MVVGVCDAVGALAAYHSTAFDHLWPALAGKGNTTFPAAASSYYYGNQISTPFFVTITFLPFNNKSKSFSPVAVIGYYTFTTI